MTARSHAGGAGSEPDTKGRNLVFLVGAGRSGSTLLYKILALHPELAYLSNYDAAAPLPAGYLQRACRSWQARKRHAWFDPSGQSHGRDRSSLGRFLPSPVEGEKLYARCGVPLFEEPGNTVDHRIARRLGQALENIRRQAGSKRIVTKRVANNRRLPWLIEAFPEARFINLLRDGRDVAHSFDRVSWWNEQARVWWDGRPMRSLLDEGVSKLEICARTWVEAIRSIERDLASVPDHMRLDVRYEQLLADPLASLGGVYRFLDVEDDPFAVATLRQIAFRQPTSRWKDAWDTHHYRSVMAIQQDWLCKYGYACEAA